MIDVSESCELLKQFLEEMKLWERDFFEKKMELIDSGQSTTECNKYFSESLRLILEKYTIKDAKSWARLEAPGCGEPTMYDPARDKLHEPTIKGSTVFIVVDQMVGLESRFRFSLVRENDLWKIKKKDTYRSGKWAGSTL
jgi:hypothetical protein